MGYDPDMDLLDELIRVTAALDEAQVPYALCGGLAVAVHGAPRATTDLDLLVPQEHLDQAVDVAKGAGFRFEATPMRFPDGMRIRRVTRIDGELAVTLDLIVVGPDLAAIFDDRQEFRLRGQRLSVLHRDGLIRMKIAAGRPQDLADVARLQDLDR